MPTHPNDIAIIGMSCRFPGAADPTAFWHNLRNGVESISFFSEEELRASGVDSKLLGSPTYVRAAGILDDIEGFDSHLFGYSPREAACIDPQQRLFLECAWEALEEAGCNPDTCTGLIAIVGGARTSDYLPKNIRRNSAARHALSDLEIELGNDGDYLATRVAYKLNLKAPSFTIQTACSTSLVAVAVACDSLLSGQCDIAMAGGVSISLPQKKGYPYVEGSIFSPDGHCRAFDAGARGVVFSNGAGLVVMKRRDDAVRDGDRIHAMVKGYAVNNDGSAKVGFTAPSVEGQAQVIGDALAMSGVPADSIGYVETHGTGTQLGDPIEMEALTHAFRRQTAKSGFCAIGSVKTNIGHTFVAAGIASLIKTVLALKHREIPPNLHFQKPNPKIDFDKSPFHVAAELTKWENGDQPLRAGVSSFGVGGTNAHVILEEPPPRLPSGPSRPHQLIVLSAKTGSALDAASARLLPHVEDQSDADMADTAYTLHVGRRALSHRRTFVCHDRNHAIELLRKPETLPTATVEAEPHRLAFLFSGQGSQYVNMGRELYDREASFREDVDRCSRMLESPLRLDLRSVLYPDVETDEHAHRLGQTALTQPALFVVQFALANLFMRWGIHPQAMIGHSIGEYAAACIAGVFSLEDALALVTERGRLMQSMPAGSMLAVFTSARHVEEILRRTGRQDTISLAAVNGPSLCVVSAPSPAIDRLEADLAAMKLDCRRLHTSHAFHSSMMEPILDPFAAAVQAVPRHAPRIPFLSNVTGTWIRESEATDPAYWVRHIRQGVRFSEDLHELCSESRWHVVELGPGRTLCALVKQHANLKALGLVLPSLPHPQEREPAQAFLLGTLGKLWMAGAEVDWSGFHAGEQRHRVTLPTYAFEHQRCWLDADMPGAPGGSLPPTAENRKANVAEWLYLPSWKRTLSPSGRSAPAPRQKKQRWLVFADNRGIGAGFLGLPAMKNAQVVTVSAGSRFEAREHRHYTLNPASGADYERLFRALQKDGFVPDRIVHLWSLNEIEDVASGIDLFRAAQPIGFSSLVSLANEINKMGATDRVELHVVTCGLFQVADRREPLRPERSTIRAACRVIPQEYANISCRHLDMDAAAPDDRVIDRLLDELTSDAPESTVAHRGDMRWVPLYEPVTSLDRIPRRDLLRTGGTYVITGGLGRIGLTLAKYIARQTRGNLALLSRSGLPPREEWRDLVAQRGTSSRLRNGMLAVQDMERAGSRVALFKADIADERQMGSAMAATSNEFGAVHGVIHASGSFARASLSDTDHTFCDRLFRAKVQGLYVLSKVLHGRPLDFCLLTSSLSSQLGGLGFAAYSASNLFMDTFAEWINQQQTVPWITINWDEWSVPEEGLDVQAGPAETAAAAIHPEEGGELFLKIVGYDLGTHIVVSTRDLQARHDRWAGPSTQTKTAPEGTPASPRSPRPSLSSVYVAPGTETEKVIAGIWRDMLGVDAVGVHDNFFDLGGHSLLATQLVARLREIFPGELPVASLFENPTVDSLSRMLDGRDMPGRDDSVEASRRKGAQRRKQRNEKTHRTKGTLSQ